MVKKILIALVLFLVIAQFFRIDKTNPTSDPQADFFAKVQTPDRFQQLIKNSCYDCHSNSTAYPWYTDVAPVSWWVKGHIKNGRKALNFSEWGTYKASKANHLLEECYEFTVETKMPLFTYTVMHPEGKLSKTDRADLANWFKAEAAKGE